MSTKIRKTIIGVCGFVGFLLTGTPADAGKYTAQELRATMHAMNVPTERDRWDSTVTAARLSLLGKAERKKDGSIVLHGDALGKLHAAVTNWRKVEAESAELDANRQMNRGHMSIASSKMSKQLNRIATMQNVEINSTTRTITGRNADGLMRSAQVDGPLVTSGMGEPTSERGWGQQSRHVTFTIGSNRWPKAFKKAQALYIAEKTAKPGASFNIAQPGDKVVATTYGGKTDYKVTRNGYKVAEFAAAQ